MDVIRRSSTELLVGVDHAPPAPLCLGLPGTPDFRGFEVDILNDIANRLGITLRFTSALWSAIIAELQDGRIDLICAAATITAQRRGIVDFSDAYLESDLAVVTRLDSRIEDPSQLTGRSIGVRVATVAEEYVRRRCSPVNIQMFDLNADAYNALKDARIDAMVDDRPIAAYFARSRPGLTLGPVLPGTGFHYGIVVARGNDQLRLALNKALSDMRADGTMDRLRRRWFDETPVEANSASTASP